MGLIELCFEISSYHGFHRKLSCISGDQRFNLSDESFRTESFVRSFFMSETLCERNPSRRFKKIF